MVTPSHLAIAGRISSYTLTKLACIVQYLKVAVTEYSIRNKILCGGFFFIIDIWSIIKLTQKVKIRICFVYFLYF